ncbi:hypothetical protein BGZ52_004615 [Haplosporangium bisporale]|nr:hypothetical protein BGZ52_004615 [Haplosporangium bisporale]KAI9237818.1 MAG: hypothetical protein BYD32DRAFT_415437 [Podila humilis]
MADSTLQIPHILNSVTDPLSFSDLLSCILVSRQWHDLFIPILWTDAITFRSNPTALWGSWTFDDYSRSTHGQQALLKNAQHIRALTCYASHSLQILRVSNCVNLVEVNCLMGNLDSSELRTGLDNLVELIAVNPQLTAVSVESINLEPEGASDHLSRFLDFLDEHPAITSVYFDPGPDIRMPVTEYWKGVWDRLISRVSAPSIHSVRVQNHTSRSKRALNGRRSWIARESPIKVKIADSELRRERRDPVGGRWESEYRYAMPRNNSSTAVMEHNGLLVLGWPRFISSTEYAAALTRFPGIQSLSIDTSCLTVSELLGPVQKMLSSLTSLDLRNYHADQEPVDSLLDNLSGITSLSLHLRNATQPDWRIISRHYSVLTSLSLSIVPMVQFYGIVSGCPVLQEFAISWLEIEESVPEVAVRWICPLRKMHFHIAYAVDMDYSDTEDEIVVKIEQAKQTAEQVAPLFMKQLGMQTKLRELSLSAHWKERPDYSPFLHLSLDPVCGLPQLSDLRDLRSVAFSGLRHHIGQDEIEWMRKHWPRLHSLEVPIMQEPPYVGDTVVEWRDTYKGQVPEYSQWFAGLEVLVPDHCYSYWEDTWFRVEEESWEWKIMERYERSMAFVEEDEFEDQPQAGP